jgi:hypothetical protein
MALASHAADPELDLLSPSNRQTTRPAEAVMAIQSRPLDLAIDALPA